MSDTISGSIGDPTASDPDFATDAETEEAVANGPDGAEAQEGAAAQDGVEPEEYASPTP
jgi:hypothetical protein